MTTAPGFPHQNSVFRLSQRAGAPLRDEGIAVVATAPIGVLMPGADPVQPDFMLIRSERGGIIAHDGRIHGVPDLIAEVLSPNNPEFDTVVKRAVDARAGVPEYWLVRPATRAGLVCSDPDAGRSDFTEVRHFTAGAKLISATLPIRVRVDDHFEPQPGLA